MKANTLSKQHLLTHTDYIQEKLNGKSAIISTISMLLAFLIFSTTHLIDDKTSGLYLAAIFTPFALLLVALLRLIYQRHQLVYAPTGSPLICGQLFFDKSQLEMLTAMLKSDSTENIEWTGFQHHGNARLSFMVSKDGQFAAVQLYKYVPYNYEAASEIFYYKDSIAHPIAQLLLQSRPRH